MTKKVELIEKRTLTSKTFDLGGGRKAWVGSIAAIHYKDEQGKWQDIDVKYSEPDIYPFSVKYNKCLYQLSLADNGFRRIYPDRNDLSYWIELGAITPRKGKLEKFEKIWKWKYDTFGLNIEIQGSQVKTTTVLNTPTAPTSLITPLNLKGLTRNGMLLLRNGVPVAMFKTPIATDANGITKELPISFRTFRLGIDSIIIKLDTAGLTYPITIDPTLDLQVGAGSDDCFVRNDGTAWIFNLTDVVCDAGYIAASYQKVGSGLRFLNVTIAPGAQISASYLTFKCFESMSGTVVRTKIIGNKEANAATFSTLADYQARRGTSVGGADNTKRTVAEVLWDNIPAWTAGVSYNSPEIRTVIQEIIDQAAWASGNALALFWDDHDGRSDTATAYTGRRAYSYDGSAVDAPKLYIEYVVVYKKLLTETSTLSDIISKRSGKILPLETLALSDVISTLRRTYKLLTETVALSDTIKLLYTATKQLIDTLSLSDTISKSTKTIRTEIMSLTDILQKHVRTAKTEILSLADTIVVKFGKFMVLLETLKLSDKLIKKPVKMLSEMLALSDTFSRILLKIKVLTEGIILTDVMIRASRKVMKETLYLADTIRKNIRIAKSEIISLADKLNFGFHQLLTETLSLVDALAKRAGKMISEKISFIDTLVLRTAFRIVLAEILYLSDILSRRLELKRVYTETLSLADTFIRRLELKKLLVDTIILSDVVSKEVRRVITEVVSLADTLIRKFIPIGEITLAVSFRTDLELYPSFQGGGR